MPLSTTLATTPRRSDRVATADKKGRSARVAAAAAATAAAASAAAGGSGTPTSKKPKKAPPTPTTTTAAAASSPSKGKAKKAPATPTKKVAAPVPVKVTPIKKTKLSGFQEPVKETDVSEGPLGVIDPQADIAGTITDLDGTPCDVMLALVDPSQNTDKFFILQLIERDNKKDDDNFVVYTRWGRTGTRGQAMEQSFADRKGADKCFTDKFRQKTGLTWEDRNDDTVEGKYRVVEQDMDQKRSGFDGATWQYWVDDGVDGKRVGWYDYDVEASKQVERLYAEHQKNGARFSRRLVESGMFTYDVNLEKMMQTNVTHPNRTSRHLRRCPKGVSMGNDPPPSAEEEEEEEKKKKTTKSQKKSAAAVVTPSKKRKRT